MEGEERENLKFDDDFSVDVSPVTSSNNTPHLATDIMIPRIIPAPTDPLRNMISSDSYIDSLEKKLQRIKGKQTDTVKGKDIINSLQMAKQEHLTRVINSDQTECYQDEDYSSNNTIAFSIQRKVNPEKQALNPQELFPLVKDDILAKVTENEETSGNDVT